MCQWAAELGAAVLGEALRRMDAHAVTNVYVKNDVQRSAALELYNAVGFRVLRDVWVYRKDYCDTE
jgi:hypothetical protein